jgi:hypothetical protein
MNSCIHMTYIVMFWIHTGFLCVRRGGWCNSCGYIWNTRRVDLISVSPLIKRSNRRAFGPNSRIVNWGKIFFSNWNVKRSATLEFCLEPDDAHGWDNFNCSNNDFPNLLSKPHGRNEKQKENSFLPFLKYSGGRRSSNPNYRLWWDARCFFFSLCPLDDKQGIIISHSNVISGLENLRDSRCLTLLTPLWILQCNTK